MTTSLLNVPEVSSTTVLPPSLIIAIVASSTKTSRAQQVLSEIELLISAYEDEQMQPLSNPPTCRLVATEADVRALYDAGFSPNRTVVLYDDYLSQYFKHTLAARGDSLPAISLGALWGVAIGPRVSTNASRLEGTARQLFADFVKNFVRNLEHVGVAGPQSADSYRDWYPWGPARRGEFAHTRVIRVADNLDEIMERLEAGPNLRVGLSAEHSRQLPDGSKLSYLRIGMAPFTADSSSLTRIAVTAFDEFEKAARALIDHHPEYAKALLAGVVVEPRLTQAYLHPTAPKFSIRRLDLHHGSNGEYASESDEMPGGLVHAYHQDFSYQLNQGLWQQTWEELCRDGLLMFMVSTDWSVGYIAETEWLVNHLQARGYPAVLLTTDQAGELELRPDGVWFEGQKVGTINRMFPIFETAGVIGELVLAAQAGLVRLVPEFAFYGNKTLFAMFRRYEQEFAELLTPEIFALLQQVIPDSHLIWPSHPGTVEGFPFTIRLEDGSRLTISSLRKLKELPLEDRTRVVLKVAGANDLAARMYGVLMGEQTRGTWSAWIDQRITDGQPFIVQERRTSLVVNTPVYHQGNHQAEAFQGRVLIRPWAIGGRVVSATITMVPRDTERVHGRVDMAQAPVAFI